MNNPFKKKVEEKTLLDTEIEHILMEMADAPTDSDKYEQMSKNLDRLYKLKIDEMEKSTKHCKLDPNTVLTSGVSLAEVFGMLHYEKLNVITSKVMSFIHKGRF